MQERRFVYIQLSELGWHSLVLTLIILQTLMLLCGVGILTAQR